MPTGTKHTWVGRFLEGNRYRVESELGRGGMGTVLLARDAKLDMPVVIKVPHAMLLNDPEFAVRFRREIRSLVTLSHAHIVAITDAGEDDGIPFAVMKYLDGGSLADRLATGPMSLESLSDWLPEIARALDFIHREGYIHRDIKPANILFDRNGHPYLSDFGIAKAVGELEPGRNPTAALTGTGMVLGTADYMAPELVMGETFDHRVDQYALAATVYEVLSGQTPFSGPTAAAIMVKQTTAAVPDLRNTNAAVSASVAGAVSRALSKQPDGRFATCAEFAAAAVPKATTTTSAAAHNHTNAMGGNRMSEQACPQCGRELRPGTKHAGKVIRCPGCQVKLRVSTDASRLSVLSAGSISTPTTALPMVTSVNSVAAALPQPERFVSRRTSLRRAFPEWLAWIAGSGMAVVLLLGVIWLFGPKASGPNTGSLGGLPENADGSPQDLESLPPEIDNSIGTRMKLPPQGTELLSNPGCEAPLQDGMLTGWSAVNGRWWPRHTTVNPRTGSSYFHPGVSPEAELSQDVEVSGYATQIDAGKQAFLFVGHIQSAKQSPVDIARILVEYRATPSGAILAQFDTGAVRATNSWKEVSDLRVAPTQTRFIRVRLISSRTKGTTNDACYDDLSLNTAVDLPSQFTNSIRMRLKLIPAGQFLMGSPETEIGRESDEGPQHLVKITRPFYLGVYEVTQEQYERVMGTNPSKFNGDTNPVEQVSWNDAVEFCQRLSGLSAEQASGRVYRLPTEAEWEYACRAGTTTIYSFGESASALRMHSWYDGNSGGETHPVGEKLPNPFGLYDMHGNVWEWCHDWRRNYQSGDVIDPTGPTDGSQRANRGGGWYGGPASVRAADRGQYSPDYQDSNRGFRLALSFIN